MNFRKNCNIFSRKFIKNGEHGFPNKYEDKNDSASKEWWTEIFVRIPRLSYQCQCPQPHHLAHHLNNSTKVTVVKMMSKTTNDLLMLVMIMMGVVIIN